MPVNLNFFVNDYFFVVCILENRCCMYVYLWNCIFWFNFKGFCKTIEIDTSAAENATKKVLQCKVGEIKVDENELLHQDSKFLEQLLWNCN